MKRSRKRLLSAFAILIVLIIGLIWIFKLMVVLEPPIIKDKSALNFERTKINDSLFVCEDNWLHKSNNGIWELYISGSPYEMGVKNGILTQELAVIQEKAFIGFIKSIIPSKSTLNYLKYFIAWFNKDLDGYIPLELQEEIYGISEFAPKEFEYIAPSYHRILNYHAAHDIGHTIQNMNLVACTAFSIKGDKTKDSNLLIGRNFDFSAGDAFAKEKVIAFCVPDSGYKFMYVSWGGMIGVLSGMNEYGLTVTLNSAKSDIPVSAKTPVSLVSRMILQYARNIDQAYKIAASYETFVSESFFIGSAEDNNTAIIEKSLDKTELYFENDNTLILTNHFQSDALKNTDLNKQSIAEGSSIYRYNRVAELLNKSGKMDYKDVAELLRDQKGMSDENIGITNEKAVNQLVCHHAIIFNPKDRIVWVSEFPYQIGAFKAYNLNTIFSDTFSLKSLRNISDSNLRIAEDKFLYSDDYKKFRKYKETTKLIMDIVNNKTENSISEAIINAYLQLNPNYYYTYFAVAKYYNTIGEKQKAIDNFKLALNYEFPRKVDKEQVEEALAEIIDNK